MYFEPSNNHEKDDTCIGYLYGHIAKANPLFKNRLTEAEDARRVAKLIGNNNENKDSNKN